MLPSEQPALAPLRVLVAHAQLQENVPGKVHGGALRRLQHLRLGDLQQGRLAWHDLEQGGDLVARSELSPVFRVVGKIAMGQTT